jgi:hypothetical protein
VVKCSIATCRDRGDVAQQWSISLVSSIPSTKNEKRKEKKVICTGDPLRKQRRYRSWKTTRIFSFSRTGLLLYSLSPHLHQGNDLGEWVFFCSLEPAPGQEGGEQV